MVLDPKRVSTSLLIVKRERTKSGGQNVERRKSRLPLDKRGRGDKRVPVNVAYTCKKLGKSLL